MPYTLPTKDSLLPTILQMNKMQFCFNKYTFISFKIKHHSIYFIVAMSLTVWFACQGNKIANDHPAPLVSPFLNWFGSRNQ